MNPAFIYYKEINLNNQNKFTLDFSDEEVVQKVFFSKSLDYYITSLDCNLILQNAIEYKDKIKFLDKLSTKSRLLLEKGPLYQLDINGIYTIVRREYDFPELDKLTYNFTQYPKIIDANCFQYKFYDTTHKRIKHCKISSPFSRFKSTGFG